MRILRFEIGDTSVYRVYADDRAVEFVAIGEIIKHLRGEGWPFLMGGTLSDPGAVLIVGPLAQHQEAAFEWRWRAYLG